VTDPTTAPHVGGTDDPTMGQLLLARHDDEHAGLLAGERRWNWREVVQESAARASMANQLRHDGPFHVAVMLPNTPEYVFWLGAAALSGAVVVGVNTTRRGTALADDLARTDCQLLITDRAGLDLLDGLDVGIATDRILVVDEARYAERLKVHMSASAHTLAADAEATGDQLLLLLFTSGTTGAPKAVRCSQGRLASIARFRTIPPYEFTRDDVAYCMMPLFHGNAIMLLWAPAVLTGATIALTERFSASGFIRDVHRYGVTVFTYVGKALAYILATPTSNEDARSTLRAGFGTEASPRDQRAFEVRFGCVLSEGYGSSEGGVAITRTPDTPEGSCGRATDDVAVVDPQTLAECPPAVFDETGRLINADAAIGEIVNRSGTRGFEGYYNDAAAYDARTRDGWYWTGDLGYRDEDGFFYFAGRSGDWLRVDSENFTTGPIERVLAQHPSIAAAAVYAVPDPRSGDEVMAAVELRPGAALSAEDVGAFLDAQPDLGTKWAPRFVRVVGQLPQTATGRTQKSSLRHEGWWRTTDAVYWRPVARIEPRAGLHYAVFSHDDRVALRAAFAAQDRQSVIDR
jgi:fatty-acyl-CoA synthase